MSKKPKKGSDVGGADAPPRRRYEWAHSTTMKVILAMKIFNALPAAVGGTKSADAEALDPDQYETMRAIRARGARSLSRNSCMAQFLWETRSDGIPLPLLDPEELALSADDAVRAITARIVTRLDTLANQTKASGDCSAVSSTGATAIQSYYFRSVHSSSSRRPIDTVSLALET